MSETACDKNTWAQTLSLFSYKFMWKKWTRKHMAMINVHWFCQAEALDFYYLYIAVDDSIILHEIILGLYTSWSSLRCYRVSCDTYFTKEAHTFKNESNGLTRVVL